MQHATLYALNGTTCVLARDLMSELTGSVPTLGGHKVVVGFGGTGAFMTFDPAYVNIPALPETDMIPIDVARQIRGFAAHEAAHLAFTDPGVDIVTRTGEKDDLQRSLWNSIEDYMIERFWLEIYPGAVKNFAATEIWCCEQYMKSFAKDPSMVYDLRQVAPVALTWMRALRFGLGTAISRDCLDTLPADLRARVEAWFATIVVPVETTQDALEASWEIFEDIMANPFSSAITPQIQKAIAKKGAQQAAKNGKAGQGQPGNGQGQPGNGQGQPGQSQPGNGQGQPGNGQGQPGQGQPGQGQPGNGQGQTGLGQPGANPPQGPGNGQGQTGTAGANGQPTLMPTPGAASGAPTAQNQGPAPAPHPVGYDLNAALKTAGIKPSPMPIAAPVWSESGKGPEGKTLANPNGRVLAEASILGLVDVVNKTAAELQRALKTIAKDRTKTGRSDGRIDSGRMAFAATGSLEYHRKVVQGQAIDTAVSIVVDCSGSMDGERLKTCQQMAVMLERALGGTPVKHEILGFTTANIHDVDPAIKVAQQAHAQNGTQMLMQAVGMYVFRPFGARQVDAMASLGAMTSVNTGGTPTSQAILLAHDRLARRKERRHVMIVLTDGQSDESARTKRVVEAVERCGVTVIGIGINSQAVRAEFGKHVVVQNARELPALMVSTLSSLILGEKRKKGMQTGAVRMVRSVG